MKQGLRPILLDATVFTYISLTIAYWFVGSQWPLPYLIGLYFIWTLTSAILFRLKAPTLGARLFSSLEQSEKRLYSWWRTGAGWTVLALFSLTTVIGLQITQFSLIELTNTDGFQGALRLINGLINPNFSILPKAIEAIIETVYIAFISTVLALPVAFVVGFLAAKNIVGGNFWGFVSYTILRGLLNIARSMEPFIWAIVFSVWVGIGPFAGMLALMVHTIASLAKQYSEQIECIEAGPIEGIQSTGANYAQVIWYGVVPQIVLPFVAFTIYRWDINVRMATVIGLVGGGGIGTLLIQYQGVAMWEEVGCIVLVIVAVVWIMDLASAYIREAIK